jgi:hypothetical protein
MNIKELKKIANSDIPEELMKSAIINSLARDENIITLVMKILDQERQLKKEMQQEMNLLLSKAHLGLEKKELNEDGFMQKEILEFYDKYKENVSHCFKNKK